MPRARQDRLAPGMVTTSLVLDLVQLLVVEAEIMPELVHHRVAHDLRHLLDRPAVFFDRPLIDRDRVREDVGVPRVAAREVDAAVEPVQRVRRLDPHIGQRLVVGPVLDHHGDVLDLGLESLRQAAERLLDEGLELAARYRSGLSGVDPTAAAEARRPSGRPGRTTTLGRARR